MPRRKTGDANGGQKSPGPKKSAKVNKITTGSARAATEKRSATARRREATKGRKATSFAQAMGMCAPGYEVLIHNGRRLVETNGPAEKGAKKGAKCRCLSLRWSSCKKHPSRIKVRTGHFINYPSHRRAVWVPKVLVDKNIIKVKKDVKFRMNKYGGKPL